MGRIEELPDAYNPNNDQPRTYLMIVLEQDRNGDLGPTDHTDFASTVQFAIDEAGIAVQDLAREYEIADSTVDRWRRGTARPHPQLQALVRQHIYDLLTRA